MIGLDIKIGDCLESLRGMPEKSVQCCVTSPPYFGLRDYGMEGQIGLEPHPHEFVEKLVSVFREVRRVLHDDGTLWLNIGDSYARGFGGGSPGEKSSSNAGSYVGRKVGRVPGGFQPKDRLMIPARVAIALQEDGWCLRDEIIWHKPNAMPFSGKDRTTPAHEMIYMLSKSPRYFYDHDAVREDAVKGFSGSKFHTGKTADHQLGRASTVERADDGRRTKRSVWTVSTKPFKGAHFATFPPDLIEPCILAGSAVGGIVLDPFGGSGTTAGVALKHRRKAVVCELNPDYAAMIETRVASICDHASVAQQILLSPMQIIISKLAGAVKV